MKTLELLLLNLIFSIVTHAQNVGIGVANPQRGKLEIAGALGGYTTVLTVGSDGAGISLQRNWPTIGFNQYRDATNTQRFIGNGHAASIFVSSDDGSIVIAQFGSGTANQLIQTATYPMYINPVGITFFNGGISAKDGIFVEKQIGLGNNATLVSNATGINNLLPWAIGSAAISGGKYRGTDTYIGSSYVAGLGYSVQFSSTTDNITALVTPEGDTPCYVTTKRLAPNTILVRIWDKNGQIIQAPFSFVLYRN